MIFKTKNKNKNKNKKNIMHATLDSEISEVVALWDDIAVQLRLELNNIINNHYRHWFTAFCPQSKVFEFQENLKLVLVISSWLDEVYKYLNIEEILKINFDLGDNLDVWVDLAINQNYLNHNSMPNIFEKTFLNKRPLCKLFVLPSIPWSVDLLDKIRLFWGWVAKIVILNNDAIQSCIIENIYNKPELDSESKIELSEEPGLLATGSKDEEKELSFAISKIESFILNSVQVHYKRNLFQSIRLIEVYNLLTKLSLDNKNSLKILLLNREVGECGLISSACVNEFELKKNAFAFEINLDAIIKISTLTYAEISQFPAVYKDITIITNMDDDISFIISELHKSSYKYMKNIRIKDIFIDKDKLQSNNRNVTLEICLQSKSKTLTDDDINRDIRQINKDLENRYKIRIQEA